MKEKLVMLINQFQIQVRKVGMLFITKILRIKLTKVHRILKFKQLDWLQAFTNFNIHKRKNVANSFEKVFFKIYE